MGSDRETSSLPEVTWVPWNVNYGNEMTGANLNTTEQGSEAVKTEVKMSSGF